MSDTLQRNLILLLIFLGVQRPLGYILNWDFVHDLATAYVASPLPLVFSHMRKLETFSSSYQVQVWETPLTSKLYDLTPQRFDYLKGPHGRRNVYAGVAALGTLMNSEVEKKPVLQVMRYGLCNGPLLDIFGPHPKILKTALHVTNAAGKEAFKRSMEVPCE